MMIVIVMKMAVVMLMTNVADGADGADGGSDSVAAIILVEAAAVRGMGTGRIYTYTHRHTQAHTHTHAGQNSVRDGDAELRCHGRREVRW